MSGKEIRSRVGYQLHIPALVSTAKVIVQDYNDLNDFPPELANTIANIVYRMVLCVEAYGNHALEPCFLPFMSPFRHPFRAVEFMKLNFKSSTEATFLEQAIPVLREACRREPQSAWLYHGAFLDGLKYGIDRPSSKPMWKRFILRKLARVREIPDLLEVLQALTTFCYARSS